MTAVPRGAGSAIASMVKPLRPSDVQRQLCSSPARRETTLDLARHHERGIEADAELADQVQIARAVAAQLLDEALGAGARDRAEILGQIVPVHADAVVPHGERALAASGASTIFSSGSSRRSCGSLRPA